ncbi:MAG TPA: NTP transferase domain-containing protein [Caulobacteraceae bacterium]|nr:NTP transferase domain-containing protein [Caulobacteraceae bacterium]
MATGGEVREGEIAAALEAIVLAGGAGARFGGAKLTHPWRGGVLIDGALGAAFAAPARHVTVVTGADAGVEAAARRFAAICGQAKRLRLVHCPDHARGMGATLRAGVASLPAGAAGAYVFLGDMPLVPASVAPALAAALARGAAAAAPSHRGRRGHPVLFGAELFEALGALAGDQGARQMLERLRARLALVAVDDPGVLVDIDRPADLDGLAPG